MFCCVWRREPLLWQILGPLLKIRKRKKERKMWMLFFLNIPWLLFVFLFFFCFSPNLLRTSRFLHQIFWIIEYLQKKQWINKKLIRLNIDTRSSNSLSSSGTRWVFVELSVVFVCSCDMFWYISVLLLRSQYDTTKGAFRAVYAEVMTRCRFLQKWPSTTEAKITNWWEWALLCRRKGCRVKTLVCEVKYVCLCL